MKINKSYLLMLLVLALGVVLAACQPQTVEVTRVVTETEVVTEEVEVTRVVEEVVTETVVETVTETVVETARGTGGTLNILFWQAASTVNPYLSGGTKDIEAAALVLEPLASYNEVGELVPRLATEIPSPSDDLMTLTWTLKEGILWSDGTPLTAEDVAFTFEYCSNPDMGCAYATNFVGIDTVNAVDDVTVEIVFSEPTPYPYVPFVGYTSPIIQKAQFENCTGAAAQECTEQNFGPIGTGPFMVREFRANDVVVYDMNPNYRDANKPFFSEVIFKGGGDAESAARAVLETGEADYAWNLQVLPEVLSQMELAGNGKVVAAFATNVERLIVNQTNPDPELGDMRSVWAPDGGNEHPFLTDPAVWQALSMAIDRNLISTRLYGSAGRPTCNVLPAPAAYVSTANDGCLVQDIEGANAMLDEAGIVDTDGDGIREKDGVPLVILYQTSTNAVRQQTQALIKQWWSEIGVETELRNVDAAVFFGGDPASPDTYGKFYADIEMYTNGSTGTDPQTYMSSWLTTEISGPDNNFLGSNVPRWYSEEYDALFAELSQTADLDARADLAKQMNDLLVQNGAMIPLVHRGSVSAHANTILGVRINAWDSELWNVADWTRASD